MLRWLGLSPEQNRDRALDAELTQLVRSSLTGADEDTVRIVAACAGLLTTVAYADRSYSEAEAARMRELLQTIEGLGTRGAEAILEMLRQHRVELSTVHTARFTRTLMELGSRDLRYRILELLLEVAAADDEITHEEIKILRQLTSALGLDQADYNALQSKHRDKLSTLR